jgi:hypothetical protein
METNNKNLNTTEQRYSELPITKTEEKRDFIYTEFPYKHLLPKVEAA